MAARSSRQGQVPEGQRILPAAVVEERSVLTSELTVVRSVVSSAIFLCISSLVAT